MVRLDMQESYLVEDPDLVSSGLFAYYKCSESSKFLTEQFDPDKGGTMGVQCKGMIKINDKTW